MIKSKGDRRKTHKMELKGDKSVSDAIWSFINAFHKPDGIVYPYGPICRKAPWKKGDLHEGTTNNAGVTCKRCKDKLK